MAFQERQCEFLCQNRKLELLLSRFSAVFLQDAKSLGKVAVSGLEMFVGQAAQQFELFTGKPAPIDLMRNAVLDSLKKA